MNGRGLRLTLVLGPPAPAATGCIMVRPDTTAVTLLVRVEQARDGLRELLKSPADLAEATAGGAARRGRGATGDRPARGPE